ncbi:MAG: carboxypeptidase regulatory-like domain-containing protein [Myxococcaceae bacterium]|nr:carboxypeptidase regulatory-like domain-containing protein [Myxococcaceae bacterium]
MKTHRWAWPRWAVLLALLALAVVWQWPSSEPENATAVGATAPVAAARVDSHVGPHSEKTTDQAGAGAPTIWALPPSVREPAEGAVGDARGRVISETSRRPIARAEITFATPAGAQSIVTAQDGTFHFIPKVPGTYQVASIRADGFLPFGPDWGKSPVTFVSRPGWHVRDITLTLIPANDIVGRVENAAGQRVSQANVRLLAPLTEEAVLFPTTDTFVTDAQGEFRFRGHNDLVVEATYGGARGRERVTEDTLNEKQLVIRLEAPGEDAGTLVSLKGRVVGPDDEGVPGALVSATSSLAAYPRVFGDSEGYRTLSGPDGQFEIAGLEAGRYDVSARLSGAAPTHRFDVKVPTQLLLKLGAGGTLRGRVTDSAGKPVSSFQVLLEWQKTPLERLGSLTTTVIDANGEYELKGLTVGNHILTVKGPGFAPAEREFALTKEGQTLTLDLVLAKGRAVSGAVNDGTSQRPIDDARVSVEGLDSRFFAQTRTDAMGAFQLEGLPDTPVSLQVEASGYHTRFLPAEGPGPFTALLTPVEPDAGRKIEGVGIGAMLRGRNDALVIGMVTPNGGAFDAGLRPGDEVFSVDGQPVTTLGFHSAILAIRGPEGSTVRLGVRRGGQAPVVDITAVRKKIQA